MYPYDLQIDGYRADKNEQWRIDRLRMVLGYSQALADIAGNEAFFRKIKALYDDEGTLNVTWFVPPTEDEKGFLNKAWNSVVTDFEAGEVVHL